MSRMIQPTSGKTDQRKVYTDWANNRLKKAGHADLQITELQKDIPDGFILPRIISAVVHEDVPGILSSPDTDYEKKQNIEACVMYLQRIGINCSGFSAKDICEGSMRAILQLFFNLSQYKPKDNNLEPTPPAQQSKLRPVSPSLRSIHSIQPKSADVSSTSKLKIVPNSNGLNTTPPGSQSSSAGSSPVSTPTSNPLNAAVTHHRPNQPRRTAGSTIPTGIDPLGGPSRRVQYRQVNIPAAGDSKLSPLSTSPSPLSPHDPFTTGQSTEPTVSTGISRPTGLQAPKSSGMLRPPGITAGLKSPTYDKSLHGSTESVKSDDGITTASASSIAELNKEAKLGRSNSTISSPNSRLKFSSSGGRSTPTLESGLARPSRLQRTVLSKPESDKTTVQQNDNKSPLLKKRSNTDSTTSLPSPDKSTTISINDSPEVTAASTTSTGSSVIGEKREQKRSFSASGLMKPTQYTSKLTPPATNDSSKLSNTESNNDTTTSNNSTNSEIKAPSGSKLQRLTQLPPPGASKLKGLSTQGTTSKTEPASAVTATTKNQESQPAKDQEAPKPPSTTSKLALLTRKTTPQSTQLRKGSVPTKASPQPSSLAALTSTENRPEPLHSNKQDHVKPSPLNINVENTPPQPPAIDRAPIDPPTHINDPATANETQGGTNDPRSSSSSIGSFNSSNSSHSESSITETMTPSPFGGRKYVRRTSPEGMSVEETSSPRDDKLSDLSNELEKSKEVFSPQEQLIEDAKSLVKRAHSLSPKVSRRIFPTGNLPSPLSDSTCIPGSEENITNAKPKRSSLRTSKQPGHVNSDKHVKISPHSSVDSFSSSDNSIGQVSGGGGTPVKVPEKRISQTERPKSLEDLEVHVFPGENLIRRGSTRSEKLDYSDVETFLDTGLTERAGSSTPELLETYETQLSHLKKDLESKARMLTMYETSMADLSTKVTSLKRTLEEKDAAIKHLTEEKQRWQDFDSHSLAPSRLAINDSGALSDGAQSDGGMDMEKETESTSGKKKTKTWKERLSLKRSSKKDQNSNHLEVVSLAGSVAGGPNRSLKRAATIGGGGSRSKPSDLISISEYSTVDTHTVKDFDTKSMDAHSEYGCFFSGIMDEIMTVYEENGAGAAITVELLMDDVQASHDDCVQTITLGTINVPEDCSWTLLDSKICDIFEHHISAIDPDRLLHLTEESILYYMVYNIRRSIRNALLPFVTPHQAVTNDNRITIALKGTAQESCAALGYKHLINVDMFQSYIAMMLETQWLVVMGTKGTCKTSLAEGLASYLELLVNQMSEEDDELVIDDGDRSLVKRFSVSSAPGSVGGGIESAMRYIKQELPQKVGRSATPILLIDNIYDCQSLEQLFSAASTLSQRPYIVSTLCSGSTRGIPLHQLMFRHNIRVVTCSPQVDPIVGILSRTLRKQVYQIKADPNVDVDPVAEHLLNWLPYLLDHLNYFINKFHSNNVALGPRVFMNCPLDMTAADMEVWFINLWNHFIIPYLMGTIMAGIETYSADPHLDWIDVREWVIETYPWQSVGMSKLKTLTPEDVGWNHAVRPQQSRFMYMRDDDAQSVLRMT